MIKKGRTSLVKTLLSMKKNSLEKLTRRRKKKEMKNDIAEKKDLQNIQKKRITKEKTQNLLTLMIIKKKI